MVFLDVRSAEEGRQTDPGPGHIKEIQLSFCGRKYSAQIVPLIPTWVYIKSQANRFLGTPNFDRPHLLEFTSATFFLIFLKGQVGSHFNLSLAVASLQRSSAG